MKHSVSKTMNCFHEPIVYQSGFREGYMLNAVAGINTLKDQSTFLEEIICLSILKEGYRMAFRLIFFMLQAFSVIIECYL